MNGKQKGFTLIEILVVVTIIGVLAGLVVVLIPRGQQEQIKIECTNNQKQFVGLLQLADKAYDFAGPNMILYFVKKEDIKGENLSVLFCPGDPRDSFEGAGGVDAYKDLDLKAHQYDHLTSYAGRDQENKDCRAAKATSDPLIMTCDDSEDHHDKKGFVCGYNDGRVTFKNKVDHWDMDMSVVVEVGEGSRVKELECLRAE